jgi:hypothetical protein
MMQTADLGEGNNIACGGKFYATRPWAVLVEREMRCGVMGSPRVARGKSSQAQGDQPQGTSLWLGLARAWA